MAARCGTYRPVVVLVGPRGSGKSAALADIRRRCGTLVPYAESNLEQAVKSPRAIVTEPAFELGRKYENTGRIHLRQLMLCLLVVGARLNPENREKALAQVRAAVAADAEFSERTNNAVDGVIDSVMQSGVIPWWSKPAVETLLRGTESLCWRRRLRRSP
ncbi:ATP-binding protein [Saccharopolyspora pogona]|uniref:ATP-binding protein n=1 Tax=Saccharopolyspora pogona TaxID=333966 RepID=UPI001CC25FCE|nr:ATP-binding protein [Saccharopolyspora pogona]